MIHLFKNLLSAIVIGVLFFSLVGYAVMFLWNGLIPSIFHVENIDFFQAVGLLLLSRLLFGNFSNGFFGGHQHHCNECGGSGIIPNKRHWKEKMKAKFNDMTSEEKEQFKSQMERVCNKELTDS